MNNYAEMHNGGKIDINSFLKDSYGVDTSNVNQQEVARNYAIKTTGIDPTKKQTGNFGIFNYHTGQPYQPNKSNTGGMNSAKVAGHKLGDYSTTKMDINSFLKDTYGIDANNVNKEDVARTYAIKTAGIDPTKKQTDNFGIFNSHTGQSLSSALGQRTKTISGSGGDGGNGRTAPAITTQNSVSSATTVSNSNNTVLQMNYEELTNLKQTISALAKDIDSSWKDIMNNKIPEIQSSWAGSDAQAYIDKVKAFDSKVMAATNALELLSDTFEKAANQLQATQTDVTRDINAI